MPFQVDVRFSLGRGEGSREAVVPPDGQEGQRVLIENVTVAASVPARQEIVDGLEAEDRLIPVDGLNHAPDDGEKGTGRKLTAHALPVRPMAAQTRTARKRPGLVSASAGVLCRMSGKIPTIVRQGPGLSDRRTSRCTKRTRRPMGSSPEKSWRTSRSLIITPSAAGAASAGSKPRPRSRVRSRTSKNRAPILMTETDGGGSTLRPSMSSRHSSLLVGGTAVVMAAASTPVSAPSRDSNCS